MSSVELTEKFFISLAGWDAVKQARGYLAADKVLSSDWSPPVLRGVVQAGETSYRAGLCIKSATNVENLCTCRQSREWGTICAHSVAIGLHFLKPPVAAPTKPGKEIKAGLAQGPVDASTARRSWLQRADLGEPAELFVILPPNLPEAIRRGKIMLCFEAAIPSGRMPLNALPRQKTFYFTPSDAALLDEIEAQAGGEIPGMMQINIAGFARMLDRLAEHPRVTMGKATPVEIRIEPRVLPLRATLEQTGEILLQLKSSPQGIELVPGGTILWVYADKCFQPLGLPQGCLPVMQGPVRIERAQVPQFVSQDLPALLASGALECDFSAGDFSFEPLAPRFSLRLAGGLAQLDGTLRCSYAERMLVPGVFAPNEALWLADAKDSLRYATRDLPAEQAAIARLQRAGFSSPDAQGNMRLAGQERVLNFFARDFARLEKEWNVTLEERLQKSTAQNIERIEPKFEVVSTGIEWFDLGVSFSTNHGTVFSPADIQRLIRSGQSHMRLKNGKIAVLDTGAVEEFNEVIADCAPQQRDGRFRMRGAQAGFLQATVKEQGWNVSAPAQWREQAGQQSGEMKLVCPALGDLETVLRPYQKHGVAWLHFLRTNRFSGILADEMGLGKTLQTLAFLQSAKAAAHGSESLPCLVVCPTSLVQNWVAEAQKFTPGLKVLAISGPNRSALFDQLPQCDLAVTSYALIRRDADRYHSVEFDTVVLDEAQHIKNRQTQNAQAVKAVRSRHRLVLTGTPMENSVLDLWSIFDFLMPGYLGSAQEFRERYEIPITREKNKAAQSRLGRRLRPFILRRLKREVASDLPPKIEQVSFCDLTDEQRAVYQQILDASRKEVLEAVGAQGVAKSRMVVLTALLRLRQVCCDLRLLKLDSKENEAASAKLDLFGELLQEIIDGGHRVLVFSQFTTMLGLIRDRLAAEEIDYCYLDGSTRDRAAVVKQFQENETVPVFLISLKAGGVGLNLTGADTVIHFDPWWNPAVEDQATDRAHRIGQKRVVTSYKLIARDTVEEKILRLQNQKRDVIKATLVGEENLAEALTWEEIQELLA